MTRPFAKRSFVRCYFWSDAQQVWTAHSFDLNHWGFARYSVLPVVPDGSLSGLYTPRVSLAVETLCC